MVVMVVTTMVTMVDGGMVDCRFHVVSHINLVHYLDVVDRRAWYNNPPDYLLTVCKAYWRCRCDTFGRYVSYLLTCGEMSYIPGWMCADATLLV